MTLPLCVAPLSSPPPPRRPYWPDFNDGGVSPSFHSDDYHFLLLFPPPPLLWLQLGRGIIILTGLTGRGRRAGTWIVTCVRGRRGGGGVVRYISVSYCSFDIMTMTHSQFKFRISEATSSSEGPGISLLTFLHGHIDICGTAQTETNAALNYISTYVEKDLRCYCIYIVAMKNTYFWLASLVSTKRLIFNLMKSQMSQFQRKKSVSSPQRLEGNC